MRADVKLVDQRCSHVPRPFCGRKSFFFTRQKRLQRDSAPTCSHATNEPKVLQMLLQGPSSDTDAYNYNRISVPQTCTVKSSYSASNWGQKPLHCQALRGSIATV